eukprot:CAMPEP_0196805508 /NCGR_PEP_ID=MMETSP1362-20130617/5297_1 /TAXON_ID=163516 /ORGANISM="Leptocylindrus danicus, Strain CCMP1856" /LENGTH=160 /DNA_ID=CAMNT_0042178493 /DNA_START=155 /DNA_END=637 /DNA_ORIENTATION=-
MDPIYTTNAEDQAKAAELRARLANSGASESETNDDGRWKEIKSVSIDDGAHKYVLVCATEPFPREKGAEPLTRNFVTSKRGAAYHRNAAEPLVYTLEQHGFRNIQILGGGRIYCDEDEKKISIFGYSYSFGQAKHSVSKSVIESDERYSDYDVSWSNEGY